MVQYQELYGCNSLQKQLKGKIIFIDMIDVSIRKRTEET